MEQGTCGHQLSPLVTPCRASFHGGESSVARVHLDIKSGEPVRTAELLRRSSGTALQPYAPTTRLPIHCAEEALETGSASPVTGSSWRRLNNRQYANSVRELLHLRPDYNAAAKFSHCPGRGFWEGK